jgi:hypothetical protein
MAIKSAHVVTEVEKSGFVLFKQSRQAEVRQLRMSGK